jgi:hypothetical protein
MTLTQIAEDRRAIVTSTEPLIEKLPRIDQLIRSAGVLARNSKDPVVRQVFDELLDLYLSLSAVVIA